MDDRRRTGLLVAVSALAFVLFTYPVLAVFDTGGLVLGVPTIALYLTLAWAGIIALVAWLGRRP